VGSVGSIVLAARGVRALADGFVSLTLPLYLLALGYTPFEVGLLSTATLLGSAALSLTAGVYATRIGYRHALLGAALLMMVTGIAFAGVRGFWPLLVVAFVGTLNPSSGDVSVFLPLEHAVLSDVVAAERRTSAFARYSLVGAVCDHVGAEGEVGADPPQRQVGLGADRVLVLGEEAPLHPRPLRAGRGAAQLHAGGAEVVAVVAPPEQRAQRVAQPQRALGRVRGGQAPVRRQPQPPRRALA